MLLGRWGRKGRRVINIFRIGIPRNSKTLVSSRLYYWACALEKNMCCEDGSEPIPIGGPSDESLTSLRFATKVIIILRIAPQVIFGYPF